MAAEAVPGDTVDVAVVPEKGTESALIRAFLEGAGVAPAEAAQAGIEPEFMHALGALARTLLARRPMN